MITLNKEILSHPDFMDNLADELCEYLEALIDAEFEKGDDCDFDFIDECADVINEIRSGGADILPFISRREFFKKITGKTEGRYKAVIAACAAIAVIFGFGVAFEKTESTSFVRELSGYISELFGIENTLEKPTLPKPQPPQTTEAQTTQSEAVITDIEIQTTSGFKSEYSVGEEFSSEGINVFAEYDNGERKLLTADEYSVEVAFGFASQAKYETVTVRAYGFEKTLEVRVIETLETKKLTSVYALFTEDFDFTAEDLDRIDLSAMQVYAVYSDSSEKELSAEEYTVEFEDESTIFKKQTLVTVSFEGCSCSFIMSEGGN